MAILTILDFVALNCNVFTVDLVSVIVFVIVVFVVLVVVLVIPRDSAFCIDFICVVFMDCSLRTTCSTLVDVAMDADIADDALDVFMTFMAGISQSGKRSCNRLSVYHLRCCTLIARYICEVQKVTLPTDDSHHFI